MGQSLVKNYVHIVFGTKYRRKLIFPPYEKELHAYIGGVCNELECQVLIVGGYVDHIHILCMLSRKIALMTLVQKIKANSSKWLKTKHTRLQNFSWQNGYATFSVNPRGVERVTRYIENQHEHHGRQNFEKEYLAMLEKHNVEYDEKYIWD